MVLKSLITIFLGSLILIFGSYGFRTWEWTPNYPLRSPVYIANYSLFYYLLKTFNLDNPLLIVNLFLINRRMDHEL